MVQSRPPSRRDRTDDTRPNPFRIGRNSLCCAIVNSRCRVPKHARTLRPPAAKTASNPDRRLDQFTKANRTKPSLKPKSHCLKIVDTFRQAKRSNRTKSLMRVRVEHILGAQAKSSPNDVLCACGPQRWSAPANGRWCRALLRSVPPTWMQAPRWPRSLGSLSRSCAEIISWRRTRFERFQPRDQLAQRCPRDEQCQTAFVNANFRDVTNKDNLKSKDRTINLLRIFLATQSSVERRN